MHDAEERVSPAGRESSIEDPDFIPGRPRGANQAGRMMEMTSKRKISESGQEEESVSLAHVCTQFEL